MSRRLILLLLLSLAVLALGYRHRQAPAPALPEVAAKTEIAAPEMAAPAGADANSEVTAPDESTPDPQQIPAAHPTRAAYRASVSQRADDRRRLQAETDLPAFVAELRARANAGDADAANTLAGLYKTCVEVVQFNSNREAGDRNLRGWMEVMGWGDREFDALLGAYVQSEQRCAALSLQSTAYAAMMAQAWQSRAVQLEHPAAVLRADRPNSRTDPAGAQAALERARLAGIELLRQAEPMDLARHATVLAGVSRYNSDGFLMAACHLLPGCFEDPHTYALGPDASILGGLGRIGFLAMTQLSPRAQTIAEAQSAEILRLWREGRPDLILAPRNPGGGG